MQARRSYPIELTVNGINISEVIIDPHYRQNHAESMNDALIMELVQLLDHKFYEVQATKHQFRFFVADPLLLNGKKYRLVWILEEDRLYVGVINAFRR